MDQTVLYHTPIGWSWAPRNKQLAGIWREKSDLEEKFLLLEKKNVIITVDSDLPWHCGRSGQVS